ncbi:MAG TPA: DUF58 domain-containing protein [Pyrinomonadaceae bacterium]|jgi:uncharacterized protein (DUF58 family)
MAADSSTNTRLLHPSVLASIGRLDLVARTVVEGFLAGLHRSPYRGISQEFAAHRPYIAGDEVRRVDWRVYARTDRLYVKEFEEETNAPVRLLLDTSASLKYAPRADATKLDYARYLAAALAYLSIRQNDRIGLTCFAGEVRERIPARGGQRHLHTILAALERAEASGQTRTGPLILREAGQWKRRGLVVLISDLYDRPEEIVEAATRLRRVGHELIVFHLLDRAEKLMEHPGTHEFRDLETGETMLVDTDRARRSYLERIDEMLAHFRREFARAGADYAELDTAGPLDKALAVYLLRRKSKV